MSSVQINKGSPLPPNKAVFKTDSSNLENILNQQVGNSSKTEKTSSVSGFKLALNKQQITSAQIIPQKVDVKSVESNSPKLAKLDSKPLTVESLQKDLGITKADAEKILTFAASPPPKEPTPQETKAHLISNKIEAVVRDKEGSIAAKLYKDGSSMSYGSVTLGYENGTSPTEKLSKLETNPNFKVTHYDGSLNDYDLLPEEMALGEKEWLKHPKLYDSQTNAEVREFNKRILAA